MRMLLLLLLLTSCVGRYLNRQSFELVSVGSPIHLIEEQFGAPYDITDCAGGIRQYRYIERIAISATVTEQIHYIFLISPDGRIVQKRAEVVGTPADLRIR